MPTASQKAMDTALDAGFQKRVQFALMRIALQTIDDDNSARSAYAKRVLNNQANLFVASVAVVANTSIGSSIAGFPGEGQEDDGSFGVADADIAFAVAEGDDPSNGVFQKLATANV